MSNNLTIAGNLTVSGTVSINGNTTIIASPLNLSNNLNTTGIINITNASSSISNTTGALQVTGGIGIAGNSFFGNTLTANTIITPLLNGTNIITANQYQNNLIPALGNTENTTWFGANALSKYYVKSNNIINCTAIGTNSLQELTQGQNNTAVGTNTLQYLVTNNNNQSVANTAIGNQALQQAITNIACTAVGNNAGISDTSGQYNTYIGSYTDQDTALNQYVKSTAIGYGATITGSNQIVLGTNTETTTIPGNLQVSQNFIQTKHFITMPLENDGTYTLTSILNNTVYYFTSSTSTTATITIPSYNELNPTLPTVTIPEGITINIYLNCNGSIILQDSNNTHYYDNTGATIIFLRFILAPTITGDALHHSWIQIS